MVPRVHRLPKNTRLGNNDKVVTPFFMMKVSPTQLSETRFAVVVSKKVHKNAVKRNAVRRQFQACFLATLPRFIRPTDILCIALPASVTITQEELKKSLIDAWTRKGVLK